MNTNTVISDNYQSFFTNISVKKPLNFFPGKNLRAARWRREREEVVCTWSRDRLLRGG